MMRYNIIFMVGWDECLAKLIIAYCISGLVHTAKYSNDPTTCRYGSLLTRDRLSGESLLSSSSDQ
jgi:hypothetical protein